MPTNTLPGIPTTQAAKQSTDLIAALTTGVDFTVPNLDLSDPQYDISGGINNPMYKDVIHLTNEDVTTRQVGGAGAFDAFMDALKAHLRAEYDSGRITGAEYTKAYIAQTQLAMANAVQFVLGKDQVFWNGIQAQLAAITARVNLGIAKVQYAKLILDAHTAKAQYALTAIQVGTQDNQIAVLREQIESAAAQTQGTRTDGTAIGGLLGKQIEQLDAQIRLSDEQIEVQHAQVSTTKTDGSPYSGMVGKQMEQITKQIEQVTAQIALVKEQVETQRSQTLDTRGDGAKVVGSVGKQKDLYDQQIKSYQRDAEVKSTKVLSDLWMAVMTAQGTADTPTAISSQNISDLLTKLRTQNQMI